MEVEALLTLKRALASGFPRHHAWALQGSLAPMLGTETLLVVRVPSGHCDAITAIDLKGAQGSSGSLTAGEELCTPRGEPAPSCTTSGAAAPPLMVTFAPSGRRVASAKPTTDQLTRPLATVLDLERRQQRRQSANQP